MLRRCDHPKQSTPRQQDRHRVGETGEVARRILRSQSGEQCVSDTRTGGAAGGLSHPVNVGIETDDQVMWLALSQPANECAVAGTDVNVDTIELAGKLGKSSVVDEAFPVAINEVHATNRNCLPPVTSTGFPPAKADPRCVRSRR